MKKPVKKFNRGSAIQPPSKPERGTAEYVRSGLGGGTPKKASAPSASASKSKMAFDKSSGTFVPAKDMGALLKARELARNPPKAPSSVLDRDRMGITPAAPSKPKSAHQEWRESAGAKSSDRKSPITAPIVKTGTVTKPNPMKRTALTPTQKAKIDKAADDLVKSAKPAAKPAPAKAAAKPAAKAAPKLSSFGAAFKAARDKAKKAGDADGGVFTWKGKQYTTKQK